MMGRYALVFALLAGAASLPAQQRTLAERLGYPADAKLVILHADDLGVAHSVDSASFDALGRGLVSSGSVMMPTPWVSEVATWAKAHPDADLGLHLTLTSEWRDYRWGSVASRDSVASLLDSAGTFPSDVPPLARRAKADEAEREMRAQVERALAMGIHPTHVDTHMGAVLATPEITAAYVRVAHAYHLPFLALRAMRPGLPLLDSDVLVDTVVMAGPEVPRDRWAQFYLDAVAHLKPGLTYMIVHLGHDDSELRAVTVAHEAYASAWRQRDYDVVRSAAFQRALRRNHVILVHWKDLQRAMAQ